MVDINTSNINTAGTGTSNRTNNTNTASDIRIVEYNPSYAKSIADMWNCSSEGWNGSIMNRTEETVLREHENSSHLNVYLAVKGDEVIGYCSLDEYTQDEGALYINTLNVRPDYHGKKVGKLLVLTAVKRTVELGWPRLDLYTWPGNTKAIPLYKKCGFFWEKRDNTTHLMNFIPTVLETEAISSFFETADWYGDCTRTIEIKPDGRKENKFDYFEYNWEKNGKKLRVEFERTGRGMRLIETDDYLVSMTLLQSHEMVFGRSYKAAFDIANKSGKPLSVAIKGINDKNISFDFDNSENPVNICGKNHQVIEASFHVGEIEDEQQAGKTHPGVAAEIQINGRKAFFKVGLLPVYPAKLSLHIPYNESYTGVRSEFIMGIENKFNEDAIFEIDMPEMDGIRFEQRKYKIELKGGERSTFSIPYTIDKYFYYSVHMPVTAYLKSSGTTSGITSETISGTISRTISRATSETISAATSETASETASEIISETASGTLSEPIRFNKKMYTIFRGRDGIIWGEADTFCEIYNGSYGAWFDKQSNWLLLGRLYGDTSNSTSWYFPKLGKPFSSELSKKKPDSIQCYSEGDTAVLKAVYNLENFKGLQLASICEVYSNAIIQHYYEIKNLNDNETAEDVWLSDTFRHDLCKGVIPYEGKFIEIDDIAGGALYYWNSEKITENWLFSYGEKLTRGIFWDKDEKIKFDNWCMFFEYNLGKLPPGACVKTKPVTVVLGTFNDWHDFREFVLKKTIDKKTSLTNHVDISVNDGNPFVGSNFRINVKDFKNISASCEVTVRSGKKLFQEQVRELEPGSAGDTREVHFDISANSGSNTGADTCANTDIIICADTSTNTNTNTNTSTNTNTNTNTSTNTSANIRINTSANTSTNTSTSASANTDANTSTNTGTNASTSTSANTGADSSSDIIHIDFDTSTYTFSKKTAVFFKTHGDVQTEKSIENLCNVLTACNGLLSIKASPDFSYVLHSLKYNGNEWLDSSFPTPGMKAWWNPWLGGICFLMPSISIASIMEEERRSEFVELYDMLGNKWKGIRNVISIEKNELYKGMKLGLYFIMLPGVPALCLVTGIVNETGRYLNRIWLMNQIFFKPSEEINGSWVMFRDARNEMLKLKAGRELHFIDLTSAPMYGSSSRNEKLHIFTDTDNVKLDAGVNPEFITAGINSQYRIMNGEKMFTQPVFLVFSDDYLPNDALKDLNNVKFDIKELEL